MLNHVQHSSLDDITFSQSLDSLQSQKRRRHSHSHRRHSHKRKTIKFHNFEAHQCAVCLETQDVSRLDTTLYPCGHKFHGECLIQWAKVQRGRKRGERKFDCPLCRQDIAHFIQMTGNQDINDQLIAVWNEHNSLTASSSSSSLLSDHDREKLAKFVQVDVDTVQKTVTPQSVEEQIIDEEERMEEEEEEEEMEEMEEMEVDGVCNVIEKEGDSCGSSSIWKFLWNSPLSLVSTRMSRIAHNVPSNTLYDGQPAPTTAYNQDLVRSRVDSRRTLRAGPFAQRRFNEQTGSTMRCDSETTFPANTAVREEAAFWKMTPIHFKAGLWAGMCAGSTTFLLKMGGRSMFTPWAVRGALLPILSETVPSVAIFFSTYEHCKRYMFAVDAVEDSAWSLYCKRFVSAGIASSLGYVAPSMRTMGVSGGMAGKGLLPLRFATFFGTFELCKDAMNVHHERLNLMEVAGAAAVGGTVSHGLYYPLMQSTTAVEAVSVGMAGGSGTMMTRQIAVRSLYKGWASSLSKFLPSCVVCSCAFEYGKRYLSK